MSFNGMPILKNSCFQAVVLKTLLMFATTIELDTYAATVDPQHTCTFVATVDPQTYIRSHS